MPKYLFEFIDAQGKRDHDFVDAGSTEEASSLIQGAAETRGYREATLLDDDLMAQLREQRPPRTHLDSRTLSRVEIVARRGGGRWPLFVESLRAHRWFLLGCVALIGFGLFTGRNGWIYAGAGGVLLHGALFLLSSRHSAIYNALIRAGALGDWNQVQALADKMQATSAISPQIAFDVDVRKALALAATGRLEEGVVLVRQWALRDPQPAGMYWSRLATVYAMGRQYEHFVDCMRQCFTESGEATWARIDLALAIARVGEDPREALELLHHESLSAQPESTLRFIHWARGVALMRLGDFPGAELALAQAVDGFMAQAKNPVVWSSLALAAGALAVAGSVNGKKDRARALLMPLLPVFNVYADPALATLVKQRVL